MKLVDRLIHGAPGDAGDWGSGPADALVDQLRSIARSGDPAADDPRLSASRSAVLTAFAAGPAASLGTDGQRSVTATAAPGIRRGGRRPAVALATAGLVVMVGAGAVAGAAPGGVLYDARLIAEELLLPTGTQDRPQAQVERLDRRLAEAERAVTANDAAAARASLAAFAGIADEAAGEPPPDPVEAAGLAARIRLQIEVLARLAVTDPALSASRAEAYAAARRLLAAVSPGDPGPEGPIGPNPSPSPGEPGASERPGSPVPTATPAPRQTPRPEGSPAGPSRTPGPASTAGPSPAATPRSTTGPGGGDGSGGGGGGGSATPSPGRSGGGSGSGSDGSGDRP